MAETDEARRKRLYMRSIRRGIKEMDIILGNFARDHLTDMSDADLETYDRMLSENDHDLYAWVCGNADALPEFAAMIAVIQSNLTDLRGS